MSKITHFPGCEEVSLDDAGEAVFVEGCECGCISFFMLRGGEVKCVSCGDIQPYLRWFDPDPETREGP